MVEIMIEEMIVDKNEHLAVYLSSGFGLETEIKIYPVINGYIYPCELFSCFGDYPDKVDNSPKKIISISDTYQDNMVDYVFNLKYNKVTITVVSHEDYVDYKINESSNEFKGIGTFKFIEAKIISNNRIEIKDKIYDPIKIINRNSVINNIFK